MSALPQKADNRQTTAGCPLCANRVLTRRDKKHRYSITSSAVICMISGIEAERLGSLEIDDQFKFCRLLDR